MISFCVCLYFQTDIMFLLTNGICKISLCLALATLVFVTFVDASTADGYRLPKTFHPENYRLKVITHLDEDGQGLRYTGKAWILVSLSALCVANVQCILSRYKIVGHLRSRHKQYHVTCKKFDDKR